MFEELFGKKKVIIGMVHFPALPGSPLYNDEKGMRYVEDKIRNDLRALVNGGIDSIMFCNEDDRPYNLKSNFASVAAMAYTIGKVKEDIGSLPFGIDVLWDPKAAIAIATATGGIFIREIITGTYVSDMGFWTTNTGEVFRYRKLLDANDVKIFFNINAEFAWNLDRRPTEVIAKSVVFSSLADVILVSGPMTGQPVEIETLKKVKESVGNTPVLANTGVSLENVEKVLKVADGAIVGTAFKKDGITWNPVDPERVSRFMNKVNSLR